MSFDNRKSTMPDVSPKPKSDFSVRNRTIAIMLAAAFIALIILGFGAFNVHHDDENAKTAAALKEKEASLLTMASKIAEREKELDAREAKLTRREEIVKKRETELSEQETALEGERDKLADEKALFYAGQLRVFELSKSLYEELAPYYSPADPAITDETE